MTNFFILSGSEKFKCFRVLFGITSLYPLFLTNTCVLSEPPGVETFPSDNLCRLKCIVECSEILKLEFDSCLNICSNDKTAQCAIPKNATCWPKCGQMSSLFTEKLATPSLDVSYDGTLEPNPWHAHVNWSHVAGAKLYVLEYREIIDENEQHLSNATYEVVNKTYVTIKKPNLCPSYAFRVAAFNHSAISPFSDSKQLPPPIPVVNEPKLSVVSAEYIRKRVHLNRNGSVTNASFVLTVAYRVPNGWNVSNGEIRVNLSKLVFLTGEGFNSDNLETAYPVLNEDGLPLAYYELSGEAARVNFMVFFMIEAFTSKCGTDYRPPVSVANVVYPSYCNQTGRITCRSAVSTVDSSKLLVKGDTTSVCNLPLDITPIWNQTRFDKVTVRFAVKNFQDLSIDLNEFKCFALNAYDIQFASIQDDEGDMWKNRHQILFDNFSICGFGNETEGFYIDYNVTGVFQPGHLYGIKMCSMIDSQTKMDFKQAPLYKLDLRQTNEINVPTSAGNRGSRKLYVGLLCGLIGGFAILLVSCLFALSLFKRRKRKLSQRRRLNGSEKDHYSKAPKAQRDEWEIDRSFITIDETCKLGAGAFGAVFKGLLFSNRQTLGPNDSKNIMMETSISVAVKRLPEYADGFSKSEFLREINLMKQLGFHEKIVNMLACITEDEPLCLIVEFCSDGDLLHYLRARRHYMTNLEKDGVDLSNLEAIMGHIDLDMILCLKDIMSFAWQVCVGLEYLWQKNFIHRDVAARNILVDHVRKAKIGDFGLCRHSGQDLLYMGKGGKLPIKWMAIEAIKAYEFTSQSDVWSFGVLLFELITLGGSPYPGIQPSDMESFLESGSRMLQPDNCPDDLYQMMLNTWSNLPVNRPNFSQLREQLRQMLENVTDDYNYLSLNESRDYYNFGQDYPSPTTPTAPSLFKDSRASIPANEPKTNASTSLDKLNPNLLDQSDQLMRNGNCALNSAARY